MTLAVFGCTLTLVARFLSWVPGRRTWFTALGAGTVYGCLLHGFVVQAANHWHCSRLAWTGEPLGELTVTLVAGLLATALCTAPVRRVFRCAVEPRLDWAFRRDPGRAAPPRQSATGGYTR